jgi:Zn-dependent M28 family amino/carboxypeptidase
MVLALAVAACRTEEVREVELVDVAHEAAPAQRPAARLDLERFRPDVDRLLTEALARGQSWQLLSGLCTQAPRRLSGSVGAEKAVQWAAQAMRDAGLEVKLEPVMVPRWERGELESLLELDAGGAPRGKFPILALGGSVATPPGGVSAEVLVVTNFDELRTRAAEARGKIVLLNRPMDPGLHDCFAAYGGAVDQRSRGASEAAKVGARAVLVRSMTMALDDHPHTGALRYEDGVEPIPAAAISTRAADALAARIAKGERVRLNLQLSCRTLPDVLSHNVVGDLVGTNPGEIIVVGGHLDAWDVGHGAHDDGAGCVHALEAVRLIRALGLPHRRTLRVVFFMNEENGARGAEAYYRTHEGELARHVLAVESDAGGFTPRGFSTDAPPDAIALLREIAALLENSGATQVKPGHGGVDIGPMARAGVPLVGFRPDDERYFDHHHCERDTLDAVHPRELALGAGAIAGLLHVVANLPEPLPRHPPKADGAATK